MARALNRLTARAAAAISEPGRHADGGGLYLDITKSGSRSWVFLYRSPVHRTERNGKAVGRLREMGLGAARSTTDSDKEKDRLSLADARTLAEDARRLMKAGLDPLDERDRQSKPAPKVPTFGEMADQFIASMEKGWRNEKHIYQWRQTLRDYAAPLRQKPVDQISVEDVLACLQPHWERRPETADRLRGRIERILNAAKAAGHRSGENPAAWRGHLENLLPRRQKLSRGHYDAMPWQNVPEFVADLRQRQGVAALGLEFLVLTAARSGEVRGAKWLEIDSRAKVWTVPAERMKAGKEHRVPLTDRALEILATVEPLKGEDGLVFPSQRAGRPLSDMTLAAVLKRMKIENATPHGFRSSFRDWCGEATSFPREIAEEALAHVVGNATERAYRRGDALERRRELMEAWARYCAGADNVVPLRKARA